MGAFSSNKKRQMENIDTTCINVRVMFILDAKEFPSKSALLDFHSRSFKGVSIVYVCVVMRDASCIVSYLM